MPLSTKIEKYDEGMLDIIEALCTKREPITLTYKDTKEARAERFLFRGLIRALYHNNHSLGLTATRIQIDLFGQDRNHPNILKLHLPAASPKDLMYKAIAKKYLESDESREKG